jgi:hypothetical protein
VLGLLFLVISARKVWLGVPASQLKKVRCKNCNGGFQALLPREDSGGAPEWGKIPANLLALVRDGGDDIHRSPLANTRKCSTCAGLGYFLVEKKPPQTYLGA